MIGLYPDTFSKDFSIVSEESLIFDISSGKWRDQVLYIQSLGKNEYAAEKKKLPGATFAGVFKSNTREARSIDQYSGLVVLDVDKVDESTLPLLKAQLAADEYVRYCFLSPSWKGLKFVVKVNTGPHEHRHAFLHLQRYFEEKYPLKLDASGKDISRLCYVSFDPQTVIKPNSKVFEVDLQYGNIQSKYQSPLIGMDDTVARDHQKAFAVCIKWVERNKTYKDGEKNVYIHALACACNRVGIPQELVIPLINHHYTTPDELWHQSVRSAYFHNQNEHASVQIKDIGIAKFVAPMYVPNYTYGVAYNDVIGLASRLFSYNVPNGEIMTIVERLCRYYFKEGYIDTDRVDVHQLVTLAKEHLDKHIVSEAEKLALPFMSMGDMATDIVIKNNSTNVVPIGIAALDDVLGGGIPVGNVIGVVGMGESYKSITAQMAAFHNAMNDIPTLYLNGEMSKFQFFSRFINALWGMDMRKSMEAGAVSEETLNDFIRQINEKINNNIFVVNGMGWTKDSVLSSIKLIDVKFGKKIKLLVSDGLSHWDWGGKDEISAAINNSFVVKEVAKDAHDGEGVAHLCLVHTSGDIQRHYRDAGQYARGGKKIVNNMDGYISTSRLIDPITNEIVNEDDVRYIANKFYLRYIDKRDQNGMINKIVNVGERLMLSVENCDPTQYELKISKPR